MFDVRDKDQQALLTGRPPESFDDEKAAAARWIARYAYRHHLPATDHAELLAALGVVGAG